MSEWHYLPRQPADDGVNTVKEWHLHGLREEFDPPKGGPELLRWDCRRLLCLEGLVGGGRVDEGGNAHRLAGSGKVFAVKEGAGPILDGVVVGYFWIPVTLAAIEGDAAACCQLATSYGLVAAEEAV